MGFLGAFVCVTRRKKQRPGIAPNDNTMHVTTARSSADLTKPNQTPKRHTRAKDTIILQSFCMCHRFLSFVAMPSPCCFLRVTPEHLAEQYNMVLSSYYCPILERTVFAVGAMVTDAVSKGADKQNVIKFN